MIEVKQIDGTVVIKLGQHVLTVARHELGALIGGLQRVSGKPIIAGRWKVCLVSVTQEASAQSQGAFAQCQEESASRGGKPGRRLRRCACAAPY